jgi:hypothetical protein
LTRNGKAWYASYLASNFGKSCCNYPRDDRLGW